MLWYKREYESNIAIYQPDNEDIIPIIPKKILFDFRIFPVFMPYKFIRDKYGSDTG